MGLDSYFRTMPAECVGNKQVDIVNTSVDSDVDLAYYRRDYALHSYMANLYERKGGEDFDYGCVRLTTADIDQFDRDSELDGKLANRRYMGGMCADSGVQGQDKTLTQAMRDALAAGLVVYYVGYA